MLLKGRRSTGMKAMRGKACQIGLICVLAVVALLLLYLGDVTWLGSAHFRDGFLASSAYNELCLLLLLGPVVYAALTLRIKGGVIVVAAESLAMIPHAFNFSPYPDPFFRLAAFTVVGVLMAGLIGGELNTREALEEEHSRLERFLAQTIDAQERERLYLARELHDESAQALVDISHEIDEMMEAREAASLQDRLEEMRGEVETVLEGTRRFIRGLRPPLLEELGLGPSLKWLAQELADEQGIEVKVDITAVEKRLQDFQELNLFRIAQEALNNVRKHSHANKVYLKLNISEDKALLRIEDNGVGFTALDRKQLISEGKFGLVGIRERVRLAGGTVRFESSREKGTIMTVEIPVKP
jgi:signal transduction histidine kinase